MLNSGDSITAIPRTRLDVAIEVLMLIGLILIPTLFRGRELVAFYSQPKFFILHFVAMSIAILWLFEAAMGAAIREQRTNSSWFDRTDEWLSKARHRWTIVTVILFGLIFLISTLLSPLPWVSVWGRDFGDLGYDLYSTLSYLVIFFTVALRTRSQDQLLRIVLSIVAVGTFAAAYGVCQAFGWDPFGRGDSLTRVIASLGNPLFLGAYLVMSIPLVLAIALHYDSMGRKWVLAPAAISIGIHISALWYAGGRGPWVAAIVGLTVLITASFIWLEWTRALKAAGLIVAGGLTALVIAGLPGIDNRTGRDLSDLSGIFSEVTDGVRYIFKDRSEPPVFESLNAVYEPISAAESIPDIASEQSLLTDTVQETIGDESDQQSIPETLPSPVHTTQNTETVGRSAPKTLLDASQIKSFGITDPTSQSIGNRADIWRGALELAINRDVVAEESKFKKGLRILFGFGPDMYFYSYPNTTRPLAGFSANSHTHNYPLQVLMEQGLAGLIALVTTAVLIMLTAVSVIRKVASERSSDQWIAILLVGLVSALTARAVEQGSGVGRVSDLVTFWALMGLVIAVAEIHSGLSEQTPTVLKISKFRGSLRDLTLVGAVGLTAIAAVLVFVQKDVNTMRAGWIAANGFEYKASGEANDAFREFQKASDLAPDVERYYTEIARSLAATAAAKQNNNIESSREFYTAARSVLLEYENRDPLSWQTQLDLANITTALVRLGNEDLRQEVITRYLNLSASMKSFAGVQAVAAANIVEAGNYDLGLVIAERAIAMESSTQPLHWAWWALGEAMFQLDRTDEAELAWETAIDRYYEGPYIAASHRGLAFINEERGNLEQAARHRDIAGILQPQ